MANIFVGCRILIVNILHLLGRECNIGQSATDNLVTIAARAALVENKPVVIVAHLFDKLLQIHSVRPVGQTALGKRRARAVLAVVFVLENVAFGVVSGVKRLGNIEIYLVCLGVACRLSC